MHTENFDSSEFVCHCGRCAHSVPHAFLVDNRLMVALQLARNRYGSPIYVTSGRRCVTHNMRVGGVNGSFHTKGLAADVRGDDMIRLFDALCSVDDFNYIEPHDNYIHVDIGRKRNTRINDKRTVIKSA